MQHPLFAVVSQMCVIQGESEYVCKFVTPAFSAYAGKMVAQRHSLPCAVWAAERCPFYSWFSRRGWGGARVYFNLVEPEQTKVFVNTVSAGQVLFDIGANVGYYSLLGSKLVGPNGKVFSFESVVRNLVYLYRHIALNKLENVTIISAACSDRLTIASFSLGDNYALGHLGQGGNQGKYNPKNTAVVPTVTVDEVVKLTSVSPDVLKIDVEGAEFQVLQGAHNTLTKTKPIIFLSVHSSNLRSVCLDYLREVAYVFETLNGDDHGAGELLATRG